jgi:hypothetical protein
VSGDIFTSEVQQININPGAGVKEMFRVFVGSILLLLLCGNRNKAGAWLLA